MMPRINEDLSKELCFIFEIKGQVEESTIANTIKNRISKMRENYNISELQRKGQVGLIRVQLLKQKQGAYNYKIKNCTRGFLYMTTNLQLTVKSILCTLTEEINKVSSYEAKFKFYRQVDLNKQNYAQRLSRSIAIAQEIRKSQSQEEEWEKALESSLNKKELITYGPYSFGSEFANSKEVFVVEGRTDLLKMLSIGYSNVMSLGGFGFDSRQVSTHLKDKNVIAFCDGDVGGLNNVRKLSECCKIEYLIPLKKHEKVEDLESTYVLRMISNRILFDASMVRLGKENETYELISRRACSGLTEKDFSRTHNKTVQESQTEVQEVDFKSPQSSEEVKYGRETEGAQEDFEKKVLEMQVLELSEDHQKSEFRNDINKNLDMKRDDK